MSIKHTFGDSAELAALYAAGAMSEETRAEFERHLDDGCAACAHEIRLLEPVVAALSEAIAPVHANPSVRSNLMARVTGSRHDGASSGEGQVGNPQIWREWASDSIRGGAFVQRGQSAEWTGVGIEGIQIRRMFVDRERNQMTMLVRMAAGTAYPRHIHDGPEECFVLEGDLQVGDEELRSGDYQRCEPGSTHPVQATKNGCLLLIVSSLTDELVD